MYSDEIDDPDEGKKAARLKVYQQRVSEIKKKVENRMGYPITGPIRGRFTMLGWERDRSPRAPKLVDTSVLGIQQDSIADTLMINIGGPLQILGRGNLSQSGVWKVEIDVLHMFARYFNLSINRIFGYVTSGGTEGNLACLWWLRELLLHKTKKIADCGKPILYMSDAAHYSLRKIANILNIEIKLITTDSGGSLDLQHMRKMLREHAQNQIDRSVLLCATVGTTQFGSIDNVPVMRQMLEEEVIAKNGSGAIHVDGALLGAVLPIIKPFGEITSIFDYADTLVISGHKFFGTTSICGVALAKREVLEDVYQDKDILVKYVGDIQDTTVSGTRSGYAVLELHHAMCSLNMDTDTAKLKKLVHQCLANASYLAGRLRELCGDQKIIYRARQFVVVFPRPKNSEIAIFLENKYGLMPVDNNRFSICVLAPVDRLLIESFLEDYRLAVDYDINVDNERRARL